MDELSQHGFVSAGIDTRQLAQTRSSTEALVEVIDRAPLQLNLICPTTLKRAAASSCGVDFQPILSEQKVIPLEAEGTKLPSCNFKTT